MTEQTNDEERIDNVLAFTKRFDENSDIKEMRNLVEEEKTKNLPYHCTHMKLLVDDHHRNKLKKEEVNTRARIRNAQFKLNDIQLALSAAEKEQEEKNG